MTLDMQPTTASDQQPTDSHAVLEAEVASVVWGVIDFLKGEPAPRRPTSTFVDDLAFNSMTVVTMYAICEELFGLELFDSTQVADQRAVGELITHLSDLLGAGTGQVPADAEIGPLLEQYG
jgi:acyl carrier protein